MPYMKAPKRQLMAKMDAMMGKGAKMGKPGMKPAGKMAGKKKGKK